MTNRRTVLKTLAAGSVAIPASKIFAGDMSESNNNKPLKLKGNINHSVSQWTFNYLSLDDLCEAVKKLGFNAIDLVGPKDWPTLQKHGIYSSMCYTSGKNDLYNGLNDPKFHEQLIKDYLETIPVMAKAGYKNLICFSGARRGMDDETGMKNCKNALEKVLPFAEKNGVTMV